MVTDAVLVVDKPVGPTSFAVVRQIRHASGVRRVGHGGTLDPLASGVLPVCLGEATKLAPFLLDADKEYDVTIRFGVETDTDDSDGAVVAEHDPSGVSEAALRAALEPFRGPISQVPPAFAAIKRDGRPLYAYARAGDADRGGATGGHRPRPRSSGLRRPGRRPPARPLLEGDLRPGAGPRSRSRARVGAHVIALRRTRSGPFALTEARPLAEVLATLTGQVRPRPAPLLVGLASALRHFPAMRPGRGSRGP